MKTTDLGSIFLTLASVFSLLGIAWLYFSELKNSEPSIFITSPLALPFYSAGILQWFLYGLTHKDMTLIITCAFQLIFLAGLLRKYWRAQA